MDLNEKLDLLSKELGIPRRGLEINFKKVFERVSNMNPTKTQVEKEELAINELKARSSKAVIFGKAEEFIGMVLGYGGLIDTVAAVRRHAQEMWDRDKAQAVKEGYATGEGKLRFKEDFGIRKAGEFIPDHNYIRHIFGIAGKGEKEQPKPFHCLLSDEWAEKAFPVFQPIKFKLTLRQDKGDFFELGQSAQTSWEKFESPFPSVTEILESPILKKYWVPLNKLDEWHKLNEQNMNRVFISLVDVTNISPATIKKTGNRIIYVDDYSADYPAPTLCWCPDEFIDFGIASRVYIVGTTGYIGGFLPGGGQSSEEQLSINVMGLCVKERVAPENPSPVPESQIV